MAKKIILTIIICLCNFFSSTNAQIEMILGDWTTIDDKENIPVSVVHIFKATNGKYYGKITKILVEGYEDMKCTKCSGELHNAPVVGMIILKDMEWKDGKLCGGSVMDPNNGKTYYGKIWYDPKNKKGQPTRLPQSFLNLKSNTMKNTMQIYDILLLCQ